MTLIATIHTTDIDQMAELVAAAKHHGPVELRYVDGGLELHRPDTTGPDAVIVPLNATPEPAPPATPRAPSRRKTTPKKKPATRTPEKTPDPCPHCGRQFRIAAGRQRHIDTCTGTDATFTTDTPIGRGPIDHDAARNRAAAAI